MTHKNLKPPTPRKPITKRGRPRKSTPISAYELYRLAHRAALGHFRASLESVATYGDGSPDDPTGRYHAIRAAEWFEIAHKYRMKAESRR